MGRRRRHQFAWLPKYVKIHKGRYVYTPYLGRGKFGKEIVLCKLGAPQQQVLQAYVKATSVKDEGTFSWLANQYLLSPQFMAKAAKTQKEYQSIHDRLMQHGNGDIPLKHFTPGKIQKYLDKRAKDGAPILGNREVAYISLVFSWGYARDYLPKGIINPCIGVPKNKESRGAGRSPEDDNYDSIYQLAEKYPWYIQPAMEIAYLCRLRKIEVLALKKSDITDRGVITRRTKGSNDAITRWSPRLRRAIDQCLAHSRNHHIESIYLIHDSDGQPLKSGTLDTAWQRLMREATEKSLERFRFHDLKIKGVTEATGDKKQASGHKSESQVARYDRSVPEVDPTR